MTDREEGLASATIDLRWLVTLRWAAIAGQVSTILGVEAALGVGLPMEPLFAIIAVEAVSNVLAQVRLRRGDAPAALPVAVLVVDVLALTGLLYFSGGPHNPFNFLYLVYIALAAVVLPPAATWGLAALSVASFGALFFDSVPLDALGGHGAHLAGGGGGGMDHGAMDHGAMDHGAMDHAGMDHGAMGHGAMGHDMTAPAGDPMALHLRGMWVAFTVGAAFIVYFVTRVKAALADRDVALAKAREAAVASERLASLATLAGGAAHELATPLGTIAIVARELELELAEREVPSALADVQLIRSQVDRCRAVLDQLAVDAGQAPGESEAALPLSELLAESLAPVRRRDSIDLDVSEELGAVQIPGFVSAMAQTLRAVVRNALDASGPEQRVRLTAVRENGGVRVVVRDEGTGMDEATLTRATEPFFTTKEHGRGMGLGLFLGRVVLERQGGSLTIESSLGHGTSVSLWFPTGDPT